MRNEIINGNSLDVLKTFDSESIDCVVTSPPYWALRDYGVDGQLGLEKTFQEYITNLCNIFDEVKRVLKKEGTCFVNIGDTYWGGGRNSGNTTEHIYKQHTQPASFVEKKWGTDYQDKCLCQIPSRFAIEMTNRGWILRNEIIWHKPNAMPASVKDRFTVDFEKVFFFVKNKNYYFEQQFEPLMESSVLRLSQDIDNQIGSIRGHGTNKKNGNMKAMGNKAIGKNKRCVWSINTQPTKEAHFATFPEKLIEPMIKAGCPEFVCNKCGKGRNIVYEKTGNLIGMGGYGSKTATHIGVSQSSSLLTKSVQEKCVTGLSDCGCNSGFSRGVTLDPFAGAGTTLLVALKNNRDFIGIDLNPEYIDIAKKRIKPFIDQPNIFREVI